MLAFDPQEVVAECRAMLAPLDEEHQQKVCGLWTAAAILALEKRNVRAFFQIGSFSWPIRAKYWKDDGESATHLTYEFEPVKALANLELGKPLEFHVWAVIPETLEIVDLSTRYVKVRTKQILDLDWHAEDPPDYLWCGLKNIPAGVRYAPSPLGAALFQPVFHELKRRVLVGFKDGG